MRPERYVVHGEYKECFISNVLFCMCTPPFDQLDASRRIVTCSHFSSLDNSRYVIYTVDTTPNRSNKVGSKKN